ncbi:MAG: hypothetical protein EPN22_01140 [Nitrospirae bacterium]|nr:MAG: hypothetical protein EPN22_01140 [Nitrospirota bacterium]
MQKKFKSCVRVDNKTYDLTLRNNIAFLLTIKSGRQALVRWLNYHQQNPDHEAVYATVSEFVGGQGKIFEPVIATAAIASFVFTPAVALPLVKPMSPVCKTCHKDGINDKGTVLAKQIPAKTYAKKAAPKKNITSLTFVNLGSAGSGVEEISDVTDIGETATGKVIASWLNFRDNKGLRQMSELGRHAPKGAEVSFGPKSYTMIKNGIEWNMRNITSINGIEINEEVFIAEFFVKHETDDRKYLAKTEKTDTVIKEEQKAEDKIAEEKPAADKDAGPVEEKKTTKADTGKIEPADKAAPEDKAGKKELTFVDLGSKGQGIESIGEIYETGNSAEAKVSSSQLIFRNDKGMRLMSSLGKYAPKGADIVLGDKAYKMVKNGVEWNMRSLTSINGTEINDTVFIAEYFIKKDSASPKYVVKLRDQGLQAKAETVVPEYNLYQSAGIEKAQKKHLESEISKAIQKPLDTTDATDEKTGSYEMTTRFGGLTVNHTFRGSGSLTIHEVSLKSYPEATFQEVFTVPLSEVKKDMVKYKYGIDGKIEKNIMTLLTKELSPLFSNNIVRQLPLPDGRFVTGIKIIGEDEYLKNIYFGLNNGQWFPLNDEFLSKILQSEPIYTQALKR